ncbi:PTS fructose transporter subunit IIABC [Falsibacillus pallidus]|uniref:PTS system D-fructose-specific IIA component (F1P-forming) (Frc family) /PTS system D-fructose-specific IIB component (F1P-forming) (Frc family) /PTS system D-fructose-specific IIC component (F1P-f... n=1 Tax=Falsibacillus pallidus TaxID=493781 RepID=A0A370GHL1_9BACI|nr:PTS fructose transporter subunit IIABC [Falsibacillus pallidus]RDI43141.1 PTS system D-fructose-specific IIA component (F1P-forming) (Frc family) /PTS system D-fructose-specific IIB component (F1P-forming) (Frc family) /PTS system D-fructose-specific IIC component (F1P-forming) (Frc family) [Falsibacillus pallidus]
MKITELMTKDTMMLDLQSASKDEVIGELVSILEDDGKLNDAAMYKQAILKREEQSTTGIGDSVAIPHAKTSAVKSPAIAFGKSADGIDYDSFDGQPAHLFFMIAATEGANQTHLEALSRLSTILMNSEARNSLVNASSKDEVIEIIDRFDSVEEEEDIIQDSLQTDSRGKVLAVTACPTGIAHTYMAADALKAKAKELGIEVKVETNGSGGAKNILTKEEIAAAPGIIVAADTKVEMERFKGKPVIQVPVADGIKRPKELLEKAVNGDAPQYAGGSEQNADKESGEKESRNGFYKHLMNGVSNMLPFVVGGGILIAISFMFGIHSADPKSDEYNRFAEILNTIGGANAFFLIVPVLSGFIAMSIADRPGFAPGMVGGLMAANGHAGFLGGLIAGFLAGYIVVGIKRLFRNLPQVLEGLKPVLIFPLLGIFLTGIIMFYLVSPLSAINTGIQDWLGGLGTGNLVILGLILGGMMAVDMGGPINKAAFTFGLAMISAGNYAPHAAVMAGGMVPPLGMAIATTIFRKKFNDAERKAGFACYFMGISFITEGAIPFAAADPLRVIPASVIGSAVAGALAMAFGIGLPAPHGGIFVFPVVEGNPFLYLAAILIGSFVTALIAGLLKKPAKN